MAREINKSKLSKSILEMKFMKRTKDRVHQEIEDSEVKKMYSLEITPEMKQGAGSFITEYSFVPCEDLLEGRLSYRGMNPEIERIMELERAVSDKTAEKRRETEVSDLEMARFYYPLVKTMESKFKKRKHAPDPQWKGKHTREFPEENEIKKEKPFNSKKYVESESGPLHGQSKRTKFLKPQD